MLARRVSQATEGVVVARIRKPAVGPHFLLSCWVYCIRVTLVIKGSVCTAGILSARTPDTQQQAEGDQPNHGQQTCLWC